MTLTRGRSTGGAAGRGIVSVARTAGDGSPGTVDTYTITYSDGTSSTYTVTNGNDGVNGTNGSGGTGSGALDALLPQPSYSPSATVQNSIGQMTVGAFTRTAPRPAFHATIPRGGRRLGTPQTAATHTLTGSGTLSEDTADPIVHDRVLVLTSTGGAARVRPTTAQATPFDLTAGHIRLFVKNNDPALGISNGFQLEVSSDNFASGNYHAVTINQPNEGLLSAARWASLSYAFNEFAVSGGTGATLTAINSWRIKAQGAGFAVKIGTVDFIPAVLPRALAVIWVDDSTVECFTNTAQMLAAYGFPGVLANNAGTVSTGGPTALSYDQVRAMHDALGWQIATHAYTNAEHNTLINGDALHAEFMRTRAWMQMAGFYGSEDASYYGGSTVGMHFVIDDHYKLVRKLFRSCRGNYSTSRTVETLPVGDPWNTRSFLLGSADTFTGTIKPFIDKAIAAKGLCEISSHNSNWTTYGAETAAMLAYLAQQRDAGLIDVVTKAEAMRRLSLVTA